MMLRQPGWGLKWFDFRKIPSKPKQGIGVRYFLSWEDGLWRLLAAKKIKKGSVILVPEFYCMDVVKNMEVHGLRVVFYPMDKYFRTEKETLEKYIKEYEPAIVVVFHVAGMQNKLMEQVKWDKVLKNRVILLEDCVHKIVVPEKVEILRKNHFVMDSWRKVVPVQGSAMYGLVEDLRDLPVYIDHDWWYEVRVIGWWGMMQLCWIVAMATSSKKIENLGEWVMERGYEVVGDNYKGSGVPSIFIWLWGKLDFEKIFLHKKIIFEKYKKIFSTWEEMGEGSNLRGFPRVFNKTEKKQGLINQAPTEKKLPGVRIKLELEGCPWTKKWGVTYLPMNL